MIHIPHIKSIIRNDMRKAKFLSLLLAASLAVATFVGTPNVSAFWVENNTPAPVTKPSTPVKKPKLSKKKLTLRVGQTKTIKVKNGVKSAKVTWKTSKKKVVKLTKKVKQGNKASVKLKALKKGKAAITAVYKLNGKTTKLKCKVTVKKAATKATLPPAPVTPAPTAVVTSTPAPTNGGVTPTPTPGEATPTPTPTDIESTPTPTPTETTAPPEATTAPPEATTAPLSLDLSKTDSYVFDGDGMKAVYNSESGVLDLSVAQFQGIIFRNPAENPDEYKYVTITYTSDRAINAYIFDGEMGDGKGQTPAGQVQKEDLAKTDTEKTVTYEADKAMYGLKIVHVDFGNGAPINMKIKSVVFSKDGVTTPPTPTAEPTATPTATPTPDGDVYIYEVPLSASKVNVSAVNGGKTYDETVLIQSFESDLYTYGSAWGVLKRISDRAAGSAPVIKYYDDDTEVKIEKTEDNEAVVTVTKDGNVTETYNIVFTKLKHRIIADIVSGNVTLKVEVTDSSVNYIKVTKDDNEKCTIVVDMEGEKYVATLVTSAGNFAKLEKNDDKFVLAVSKALVEKYQFALAYQEAGAEMGPDVEPVPTSIPAPAAPPEPLIVSAQIDDVPELYVKDTALVGVSVDIGTVEDVEWSVEGSAATIEQDPADKTKAVITAVEAGNVTVSAKVTVSDAGQSASDTAVAEFDVKPLSVYLDLSAWNTAGFPMKQNEDGSIEIEFDNGNYRGSGLNIPAEYSDYKYAEVSVTSYREDGIEMDGGNQVSFKSGEDEVGLHYGKGVKSCMVSDDKSFTYLMINAQESHSGKQIMKINYVKMCRTVTFDISDLNPGKAESKVVNEDGSVTLGYGDAGYCGSEFVIPEKYRDCTYFELYAPAEKRDETLADRRAGIQVVWKDENGQDIKNPDYIYWSGYYGRLDVPEGKKLSKIIINNQDANSDTTVYYIKARY